MEIIKIINLGTCICCGFPHELSLLKEGAFVVGCNLRGERVNPECSIYTTRSRCYKLDDCPLKQPETREMIKDHARIVFNHIVEKFREDGCVYLYIDVDNNSFHQELEALFELVKWNLSIEGTKRGFTKLKCFPASSFGVYDPSDFIVPSR